MIQINIWMSLQRRDTHIRYSIQCSKLHFCFYKVPFGSPECWLIKSWCWWTKRQKNLCIMNIDIFSFDLQWMIFKRISVLNLGGIYCENKNKSHTKFKMFLCMKNPNETILHFTLSLKFLFKNVCCCISLFLSMQLQFQYYIIRGIY